MNDNDNIHDRSCADVSTKIVEIVVNVEAYFEQDKSKSCT